MAQPDTFNSKLFSVFLGATPSGTFMCGVTSRGFGKTGEQGAFYVPNLTNVADSTPMRRIPVSHDSSMQATGRLNKDTHSMMRAQFQVATSWCIQLPGALAAGGGYYAGTMILSKFELTSEDSDGSVTFNAEWVPDGEIAWTDAT